MQLVIPSRSDTIVVPYYLQGVRREVSMKL